MGFGALRGGTPMGSIRRFCWISHVINPTPLNYACPFSAVVGELRG